ncbi:hypothetical protein D9M69_538120 [compost metagenome]
MHDPRLGVIARHLVLEPGLDRLPLRRIGGHGFFIAVDPATDLALHVAFRFTQVGEAAGLVINVVQLDQLVDEVLAQLAGASLVEVQLRGQLVAQDDAVDPFHDVELGADHRFVGAVRIGLRAIGEAGVELVEDAVFAPHVMGRLGLAAERRAAQDELLLRVFDQVGQVGGAAGELADPRCAVEPGNVSLEIRIDCRGIEFFTFADASGLVSKRHTYPF